MSMPRNVYTGTEFQCVFFHDSQVNFESFTIQNQDILGYQKPSARCCETRGQNRSRIEAVNAKSFIRLGAFSEQKWVWAWVLNLTFFRDRLGAYKNRFGRHFWGQNGVPRPFSRVCFSGFQLRDAIIEKMHPSQAKTMFLHVDEVWKWVDLGFQNRSKIVAFSTCILEAIFVDFLSEKSGFGSPRRRPNFSKNRSQDDSLEVLKKVSLKLSSGPSSA